MNRSVGLLTPLAVILLLLSSTIASSGVSTHFEVTDEEFWFGNSAVMDDSAHRLLIIADDEFVDDLDDLMVHKEQVGLSPRLVSLSEVYDQMYWFGRDEPEKIKYFIWHAVELWDVEYVLLVGDFRRVPVRYVENSFVDGFYEPSFVSELYYADVFDEQGNFSSWDSNGNGVFGEWIGQSAEDADIDLYPDVAVGRLACRTAKEVRVCVDKIISYETNTFGSEWFNRAVVVAGDTYLESDNPEWTGYEGEENANHVLENLSGFDHIRLFTSDGSFSNKWDVIRTLSQGCGLMYFDGHANPLRWGSHAPNDDEFIVGLSVPLMSLLRNREKLPVVVVGGCHNSQFDVHPAKILEEKWYYFTWIPECWSWKLTRWEKGGSIATIGCSGLGMTKEDKVSFSGAGDFLEPSFFYNYNVEGYDVLGECWAATLSRYLDFYPIDWSEPAESDYAIDAKSVQQWVLLGDPSLKIGGYPPSVFGSLSISCVEVCEDEC